jgi:inosose dehydratase
MTTFRIGHSGITWGYDWTTAEEALRDVAELGYAAFETFGSVLEHYAEEEPGGFGALLERYGIPLSAAYCPTRFYDPGNAAEDIENAMRWAELARGVGADTIVLQAGQRSEEPYRAWQGMAEVYNEIGRRVQGMGMVAAIHPHTGTLIETREEIDAILGAVDPDLVGFAPDTGQIAKGGGDAVAALRAHKERIWHVHLKDYAGGEPTGYAGYAPVGAGVMDMSGIFEVLEEAEFDRWISVELDGTPQAPRPPREAAAMSKRYLEQLLGERAAW